jgi:hypothetical protein
MKLILFSIFAVLLAAKNCEAFPYPIPEPKQSSEAATTLVMKSFAKEAKDYPPRWRDEAFAQSIIYTTFERNTELQDWVDASGKESIESDCPWLLTEWGWMITVVMAHDLSQKITYFVRPNGAVELLWHTD